MILPEALRVENYRMVAALGLVDTLPAVGLPYLASGFGTFLLRQAFLTVPRELDDAARVEGAGPLGLLWPLIVTNSVGTRPITVGLLIFASPDQGVSWALVSASSLISAAPLLVGFPLFQRAFVQNLMRAGIE